MTDYSEARKTQICEALSTQALLKEKEFYKKDLLSAKKAFADALFGIVIDKEHSSHLKLRDLGNYLRNQAREVGLENDDDVKYTANQLDKLSKEIYILESGEEGESIASRALQGGIEIPSFFANNVELHVADEPYEIDFVVINKSGIYTIEAKHYNKDAVIDELGRLTFASYDGTNKVSKNICVQMAGQRNAIFRIIQSAFPENDRMLNIAERVKSVLVTTGACSITDVRGQETIVDSNNIAAYLNRNETDIELTRDEIFLLGEAIKEANHPGKYDVNYDYERVARAFALAVAKIEFASEKTEVEFVDECEEDVNQETINEIGTETNNIESKRYKLSMSDKVKIGAMVLRCAVVAIGIAAIGLKFKK